jgi:acylpyruvate hydrolase
VELVRFSTSGNGGFRPGLLHDGSIHDLGARFKTVADFLCKHPQGWGEQSVSLQGLAARPASMAQLGPPIDENRVLYLIAANYKAHAQEAGLDVPEQPVIFSKPYTALLGHNEAIELPAISQKMDYEGELAVVIGKTAKSVPAARAAEHVAGYTIVNDVTARDLQWTQLGKYRIVDWLSSKSLDRSTPVGPWIVSAQAVGNPHRLALKTTLNGRLMQDADTSMMVFPIWQIIEYLSARVTLRPGDIIATGTPFGVGGFREVFLKEGDVLSVEVERVGRLQNSARAVR